MTRAKKSFGQNWLMDKTVVKKIVKAAQITPGETVLEVGPGTGVLTQALVDAGAHVIAVEADTSLIAPLRERFGDSIELIEGDVLSWGFTPAQAKACGYRYKLIANIPYNITSDLLRRFLTTDPKPSRMILMVQKEVADRITAVPPDMSLLSVMCQLYAKCKHVAKVPAGAFRPIPKVDSTVVQFEVFDSSSWGIDPEDVIALVKRGFCSRRKQLHGNLKSFAHNSEQIKQALKSLGLSPSARAQELSVENWIALTHILNEKSKKHLG
ncbi:ribosomal RNA small subunit methyltransferase A [Candidatus Uhrbacteria bacterium]|nr:ribosomal RNA small subunit methyltransferase A [Candidatus Uhrbacteria bacterium]